MLNPVEFTTTYAERMSVSSGTFPAEIASIPIGTNTYTPIANANSKFTLTATDYLYTIDLGIGSVQAGVSSTQKFFTIQSSFTANPNTITISLPQVTVINKTQDTIKGTIGGAKISVAAGQTPTVTTQMTSVPNATNFLKSSDFSFGINLLTNTPTPGSGSNQAAYTASISQSGTLYTITVSTATVQFTNATLNPITFTFKLPQGADTSSFFNSVSGLTSSGSNITISGTTDVTKPLVVNAVVNQFIAKCGNAFSFEGAYGALPGTSTNLINVSFIAGRAPIVTPIALYAKGFTASGGFDQSSLTYSFSLIDNSTPVGPVVPTSEQMVIYNDTGGSVTLAMTYTKFDNKVMIPAASGSAGAGITFQNGEYTIPYDSTSGAKNAYILNIPSKTNFANIMSPVWDTSSNQFVFMDSNQNWIYLTVVEGVAPVLFSYSCGGYGTATPPDIIASYTPPVVNPEALGTYSITIPKSSYQQKAIVFNNNTPYNIFTDIGYGTDPLQSCMSSKYPVYSP